MINLEYAKNHLLRYASNVKNNILTKNSEAKDGETYSDYLDIIDKMMNALATEQVSIPELEMYYEFLTVFSFSVSRKESADLIKMRINNYNNIVSEIAKDSEAIVSTIREVELLDLSIKNIKLLCKSGIELVNNALKEIEGSEAAKSILEARKAILEKMLEGLNKDVKHVKIHELALILMEIDLDNQLLNQDEVLGEMLDMNLELGEFIDSLFPTQIAVDESVVPAVEEEPGLCEWLISLIAGPFAGGDNQVLPSESFAEGAPPVLEMPSFAVGGPVAIAGEDFSGF